MPWGRPSGPKGAPTAEPGRPGRNTGAKPRRNISSILWKSGDGIADGAEIARRLAERHDLAVVGFDRPGLDPEVLLELAAAVDDVLTRHPYIDLREVAVAPCGGETSQLEWGRADGATGPATFVHRIVLDSRIARDPRPFVEYVRGAVRSGLLARGSQTRPIYSTVVREFGHALDVMGLFRARAAVEPALIVEYSRRDRSRIAEWRNEMSGCSFHNNRLHPGMAMADAFTEVFLEGAAARPPARVLHDLLVATAQAPVPPTPDGPDTVRTLSAVC